MTTIFNSSRYPQPVADVWRQLVYAVTNRVGWPESTYLLNSQHRFICCPIAKVACTSLKLWLLHVAGDRPEQPFNEHVEVQRHSLRRYGNAAVKELLADSSYFKFAFVRNPWSRVVSAYLNKFLSLNCTSHPVIRTLRKRRRVQEPHAEVTFREFVEFIAQGNPREYDEHWRPQYLFLNGHQFDLIGRFEHFAEDFALVRDRLGIQTPLPRNNVTQYAPQADPRTVADFTPSQLRQRGAFPDYQRFYTPELYDLVAKIYAVDIKQFGYG